MRIVVNDIAASNTGALSILRDFYNYIKRDENREIETREGLELLQWTFLLSDRYIEERDNIRVITLPEVKSWKKRLAFDLHSGGSYIMSLKPDVYFSMQNTLTRGVKCKKVVYVHQPLCFQRVKDFSLFRPEEREYAIYQHIIGRLIFSAIKRADRTIVQTEWMRDEAIRRTKVSGERVVRITPDIDVGGREPVCDSFSGKRFFYPSGDMLYKNHACIIEAVKLLLKQGIKDFEIDLTLTKEELLRICPSAKEVLSLETAEAKEPIAPGMAEAKEPSASEREGAKERRRGVISCLGRISREEVLSRYRKSVLLFPSYIESFGYPPAEARAMGGAILASDTPSSLELLSGYDRAYYFDPFRPEELCELMKDSIEGRLFGEKDAFFEVRASEAVLKAQDPTEGRPFGKDEGESSWAKVLSVLTD